MQTISADERRALKLIATAPPTGCTDRLLMERGFSLEFLAGLVRADLADVAAVERIGSGHANIICRLSITDAGKRAISRSTSPARLLNNRIRMGIDHLRPDGRPTLRWGRRGPS